MSNFNANTPDFVPGGASANAAAIAPVNPFLKLAAKEFVPSGSAPAFVPGVGFGGAFSFAPSFVPTSAAAFVPQAHLQQRVVGKKEGDDMSLSEESDDESQTSNGALSSQISPDKPAKVENSSQQQPKSATQVLSFADRLKATKTAPPAAAAPLPQQTQQRPVQQQPSAVVTPPMQQLQQPKSVEPMPVVAQSSASASTPTFASAAAPATALAPAPAPAAAPASAPAPAHVPDLASAPAPVSQKKWTDEAGSAKSTATTDRLGHRTPSSAAAPLQATESAPASTPAHAPSPAAAHHPSPAFTERSSGGGYGRKGGDRAYAGGGGGGGGSNHKSVSGNPAFAPETICAAFAAPVLVPEGSELLVKFGTKAEGVQKYSVLELLAIRPYVQNIAALPEQLDKRTDPAKIKSAKPAEKKEKKPREKHTHREDRWVPAIVTDADHKLKKDVTDILNKLTPSNFEKLCERFLALEINTVDRMVMCVQQLHEIAMKFATYSNVYADLCEKLQSLQLEELPAAPTDSAGAPVVATVKDFKKTILNTCQAEFSVSFDQPTPEVAEALAKLSADDQMIEDNKRRTRQLGNITFIAELYKRKMLKVRVILLCISELEGYKEVYEDEDDPNAAPLLKLETPSEEGLLCLCRLIATAGQHLESESEEVRARLDQCFAHLDEIILDKATYSSKVRFSLMDLRDLRSANWVARKVQQKQEATTSEQQGKELPPTPDKKPETKEFGKGYKAQAVAKASGGAPSSFTAPVPAGGRLLPPKDFKGPRDDRKKKEKPVDAEKRKGGGDEWETVGGARSKGKPALKVSTTKSGWGSKVSAAPATAPAAIRKNTFDFGDEDSVDDEDEEDVDQEVDNAGSKSTGASAGSSNFVESEVAAPLDALAEAFDAKYKKKARGLLDELFSCHLLDEADQLLVEMALPLDMSRCFAHLCVSHSVASGKPDAVDLAHRFLVAAVEKRLLDQAAVVLGALDVVMDLDDICVDTPIAARLYGVMCARMSGVGLSAEVVKQRVLDAEELRPKFKDAFVDGLDKTLADA